MIWAGLVEMTGRKTDQSSERHRCMGVNGVDSSDASDEAQKCAPRGCVTRECAPDMSRDEQREAVASRYS